MTRIGIYFGTDTGNTRRIAKLIASKLGEAAAPPVNINKACLADLAAWPALILGTCTLGEGALPGRDTGGQSASWAEFMPQFEGADLRGKVVALYGLGDQVKYGHCYVDALRTLHDAVVAAGATVVGAWPTEGYDFKASEAVEDGHFVGLALDQDNQKALTEARLERWLAQIRPQLAPD